ncbi:hypothetical protein CcaCcLH18_09853 [Colletotrichum camelliae]|nr:hypothetical protein CcaCcLH18_09853 [Colletotrichum camelliae]
MDEYRHGKPIDDLPQTFKDFVKVARHFNVRYVWIDCICIIQDSVDDWEQQASTMASVYSNATCNIAAAAASDPEQGLFTSRVPQNPRDEIVSAAIVSTTATDYYAFVDNGHHLERQLGPSFLRERGWIFQEWFLSPRVIHFTREQAIWECCNGIKKSETFPFNYPWNYFAARSEKIGANDLMAQRGSVSAGSELLSFMSNECLEVWVRLVIRYSGCSLTHPEDKLLAVSGLAKHFLGICGDAYYAGMWRTNLVYQICWRLRRPCPRPTCGYRAPSWSWASVDGPVWVDGQDFVEGSGWNTLPTAIPLQIPRTYWTEVVDVKVGTKTEDCTVGITSGFLRVRSYIFDLPYVRVTKSDYGDNHRITFDGKCWPTVDLFPDTKEDDFGERGSLRLLVLLTDSVIERDEYDNAQWQTRADPLDVEEEGSELSRLATDSMNASADEEAEGPDNESNKDGHLGEGVGLHVAIEDDAMDVEHIVDEGTEYSGEGSKDGPEYSAEESEYWTGKSGEGSEYGPVYSGEGSKYGTEYSAEESEDDPPMSDDGCPICETADAYMSHDVPATTCLVVKPAEALESVGEMTYRRVGLLRTDSRACARHMLVELVRQSPDSMQEAVLI